MSLFEQFPLLLQIAREFDVLKQLFGVQSTTDSPTHARANELNEVLQRIEEAWLQQALPEDVAERLAQLAPDAPWLGGLVERWKAGEPALPSGWAKLQSELLPYLYQAELNLTPRYEQHAADYDGLPNGEKDCGLVRSVCKHAARYFPLEGPSKDRRRPHGAYDLLEHLRETLVFKVICNARIWYEVHRELQDEFDRWEGLLVKHLPIICRRFYDRYQGRPVSGGGKNAERRLIPAADLGDFQAERQVDPSSDDPARAAELQEMIERLQKALEELTALEKEVVELVLVAKVTPQEAARMLGLPLQRLRDLLRQAKEILRRELGD